MVTSVVLVDIVSEVKCLVGTLPKGVVAYVEIDRYVSVSVVILHSVVRGFSTNNFRSRRIEDKKNSNSETLTSDCSSSDHSSSKCKTGLRHCSL